jgi:hypothetical protein
MKKSSVFKDEIYKIVKYQTKLASSNDINTSYIYRNKLSEHVEKMRMVGGGEKILKAMRGGNDDDDFLAGIVKEITDSDAQNKQELNKGSDAYTKAVKEFEEAANITEKIINEKNDNITQLLTDAQMLHNRIDDTQKNLVECNDGKEKIKQKFRELADKVKAQPQGTADVSGITAQTQRLLSIARTDMKNSVEAFNIKIANAGIKAKTDTIKYDALVIDNDFVELKKILNELISDSSNTSKLDSFIAAHQ